MKPVILFRSPDKHPQYEDELVCARENFDVITSRMVAPKDSIVIGRYSVLPYYKELEEDLKYNNSKLINSYRQHRWIADLSNWYLDFMDITPKTWFHLHEIPNDGRQFVLKGETNSRKYDWKTHMFAANKEAAGVVYSNLMKDSLISSQSIYIREYVPLMTLRIDATGLPITEEYRFFILYGQIVSAGFYWSSHAELLDEPEFSHINPKQVPQEFLADICERVKDYANFVVVDVARTVKGQWIVIELNDGQQSGLSECDPKVLYSNMKSVLDVHGC